LRITRDPHSFFEGHHSVLHEVEDRVVQTLSARAVAARRLEVTVELVQLVVADHVSDRVVLKEDFVHRHPPIAVRALAELLAHHPAQQNGETRAHLVLPTLPDPIATPSDSL